MRMFFWPFMALLVIGAFFLRDRLMQSGADGVNAPAVGKPLETVALIGLTDDAGALDADSLKSKVTLINFWGYWCPPCVQEMPEILELRDEFARDERFQLVSVACHAVPDKAEVLRSQTLKFLERKKFDVVVHADPAGATRMAVAEMNGDQWIAYPSTLLVGPDGVVRAMWVGYSPTVIRQQRREIAKLLK